MSHDRQEMHTALRSDLRRQRARTRWLRRLCLSIAVVEITLLSTFWAEYILGP